MNEDPLRTIVETMLRMWKIPRGSGSRDDYDKAKRKLKTCDMDRMQYARALTILADWVGV